MFATQRSAHPSVGTLAGDGVVRVAVALLADRTVPLPAQPGLVGHLEAPPSAAGYQSPGRLRHGLWSDGEINIV